MQRDYVVWTAILSGLLLTLNVLVAENQGPQNVGGRKIGHRPQARAAHIRASHNKKPHAPPIGSDMDDPEDVEKLELKPDPTLSEEDLKLLELAQQLRQESQENVPDSGNPETEESNGENVERKDSAPDNSQKESIEKESVKVNTKAAPASGKRSQVNSQVKNGQINAPKHSEKEGKPVPAKVCVDCETGTEEEKKPEIKTDPEIEATEKVEKAAEGAENVQPDEAVAKETDAPAPDQEAKPAEGDTQPVDQEVPLVEELSTVNLPPVENIPGAELSGETDTQEHPHATPEDATVEPEADNKEADFTAPTQDSDMPSFDEWKKRMLAEQEQQEKSKQLEAQVVHTSAGSSGKKPGKGRNYASLNCGAKILASNPEAQNSGSVLSENRDSYIIQPCKAKKWFVVELCEPVQVRSLEIANLELFSSLPEKFVVNISDRYPTKEWKTLGTFHARDERAVQSFSVDDVDIYAKYLRIEMLSHYGREHYCPLTILRVFGTTVEEDDDADHSDSSSDDAGDGEEGVNEEPANLFSTATGTVLSLVKTVLSPGEKEVQAEMEGVVALNGTAVNQSVVNVTEPLVAEEKKEPCAPAGSMDDNGEDEGVKPQQVNQPEAPLPEMYVNGNAPQDQGKEQPAGDSTAPTVEKQDGAEVDKPREEEKRIVTLIESPISLNTVLSKCHYCEKPGGVNECYFDTTTACGYYKFLKYVYPTCCYHKGKIIHEVTKPLKTKGKSRKKTPPQSDQKVVKEMDDVQITTGKVEVGGQATIEESLKPSRVTSSYEPLSSKTTESLSLTNIAPLDSDASKENGATDPPETVKISTTPVEMTATVTMMQSSESVCDMKGDATDAACNTMGPGVVQIRPTATTEDASTIDPTPTLSAPDATVEPGVSQGQGREAEGQGQSGGQEKPVPSQADTKPPPPEPTERVIHAEETVDSEYEQAQMPEAELELVKYSSEKKQTTFMKLKNRIKMLELNLNLSSRYLEELSQRYKRQMEEMYISLNRTITKLTNTSKSAEARDLKQQEHISQLQKRIANLTGQLTSLSSSIANIHSEVIERHLFLMLIELVAFLILFTYCLHRNNRQVDNRVQPIEVKTPVEESRVQDATPKKNILIRRNSIGSSPSQKTKETKNEDTTLRRSIDDLAIRRSGSEGSFGIIDPSSNVFINQNPDQRDLEWKDQVSKKRKKKHKGKMSLGMYQNSSSSNLYTRQSSQPGSSSGSQDGENYSVEDRRSSSFTSWAGVLFGKPRETPSVNGTKQEVTNTNGDGIKPERHKDKRKPFKGRRSLDLHLARQQNGSLSHAEKLNGHRSHVNGDLSSAPNGVSPKNSCVTVGRVDLTNGHETHKKSSLMNGSPSYYNKEGTWKNSFRESDIHM